MEYTVRFEGVIRAVSPLATNPPGTPEGRALPGQSNPPKPIPKATVLIDGTAVAMVPIFPGPGIRGTLRRKAVDVVRHALGGGGPVFLLDDHYYNVLGGVKGAEKEEKADLVAAAARRARQIVQVAKGLETQIDNTFHHVLPFNRSKTMPANGVL